MTYLVEVYDSAGQMQQGLNTHDGSFEPVEFIFNSQANSFVVVYRRTPEEQGKGSGFVG